MATKRSQSGSRVAALLDDGADDRMQAMLVQAREALRASGARTNKIAKETVENYRSQGSQLIDVRDDARNTSQGCQSCLRLRLRFIVQEYLRFMCRRAPEKSSKALIH